MFASPLPGNALTLSSPHILTLQVGRAGGALVCPLVMWQLGLVQLRGVTD